MHQSKNYSRICYIIFYTLFKSGCIFYTYSSSQFGPATLRMHISHTGQYIHCYGKSRSNLSGSFHIPSLHLAAEGLGKSRLNNPGLPNVRFHSFSKYIQVEEKRRSSSKIACGHVSFREGKFSVGCTRHENSLSGMWFEQSLKGIQLT